MSWQALVFGVLALVLVSGFIWYERSRPPARLVALVAALAALAVAGRLVLAPIPNVVATTDIALFTGYALGAAPGFAVGALAAPISNIWLGQGPWTLWEMAGWGFVGLGGAWLAVLTARRLGRLGLALVCAAAGLGYGLLADLSVMVSYGGEQSLDRYLALSARGLPFNVAHAIGNFTIAFVAGPALVRMISRYRTRMEFRWRPAPAATAVLAALAVASAALAFDSAQPAAAEVEAKRSDVERARTWLGRSQNRDGGFAASRGNPSSPAMTGWAMLGLEAAGRNPLDVRKRGRSPVAYLRKHVGRLRNPGDLERTILAVEAAGVNPRSFAGVNLVNKLRDRRRRDGSVSGQVNLTSFYVLSMRAAGVDGLGKPAKWLRKAQNGDGGWGFRANAPSDPDSTGAALQALRAAGAKRKHLRGGVRWLRKAQRSGGGWGLASSGVVNTQSTAWAVQGLVAAGVTGKPVKKALAYLQRQRASDGHFRYSRSSDQTPVWVTAQVLLALERKPFPLERVPRRSKPKPSNSGGGNDGGGSSSSSSSSGAGDGYPTRDWDSGWDSGSTTPDPGGFDSGTDFDTPYSGPSNFGNANNGAGPNAATGPAGAPGSGPAAAEASGGMSLWEALWAEAQRNAAEQAAGQEGETEGAAVAGEAVEGEQATDEYTPASDVSDERVAPIVGAGFAGLVLALWAGFVWYRRRLP